MEEKEKVLNAVNKKLRQYTNKDLTFKSANYQTHVKVNAGRTRQ